MPYITADLGRAEQFRGHLLAITRIEASEATDRVTERWIGDFELDVFDPDIEGEPVRRLRWDGP